MELLKQFVLVGKSTETFWITCVFAIKKIFLNIYLSSLDGKYFFPCKHNSKNERLSVSDRIWYLDLLEYVEFNGDVLFFTRNIPFWVNLVKKLNLFTFDYGCDVRKMKHLE